MAIDTPTTETPKGRPSRSSPNFGHLDKDVYTATELHERLGIKKDTLLEYIRDGELPAANFGGSTGFRILHEDVMEWLRKRARRQPA